VILPMGAGFPSLAEKLDTIVVSYPRFCPLGPRKLGLTSLLEAGEEGAEPAPRLACFLRYSSRNSGAICHFIPLPGSSVRRGTFWKALFRERLWRMEFWGLLAGVVQGSEEAYLPATLAVAVECISVGDEGVDVR
jgi:hypothetical protein